MIYIRAVFRFTLFIISTFGLYTAWLIGNIFIPNKQYWRQIIFRRWGQAFVTISHMKIEVVGTAPEPPFFLVSNHLSYTDVPLLCVATKGVFVAKGEMESWFLAGRIVRDMGTIFINRQNRRDIPRAGSEIIKRLDEGEGVIVFPEGTSTKGETILPFNSSFLQFAAQMDCPVSYASITYQTPDDAPKASETICWWDEKTFAQHLWYLFQIPEFTAIINFGDEPVQNHNRKELAQILWTKVNENFVPVL
ncbi:MAG: 1-acyl-sn-glycerol-3-phosphate acyltransferase [Acidobacteria bacterium]|jgi:1-acyl-sn-glycerol-3-phosphate acyltransferase|nr:1-acyl-sn-glycerol-3-phosphate acyltransferase [Acidobacteriota bacterium]